jgi:prepilin-type processing-associated H-X9-DG protein
MLMDLHRGKKPTMAPQNQKPLPDDIFSDDVTANAGNDAPPATEPVDGAASAGGASTESDGWAEGDASEGDGWGEAAPGGGDYANSLEDTFISDTSPWDTSSGVYPQSPHAVWPRPVLPVEKAAQQHQMVGQGRSGQGRGDEDGETDEPVPGTAGEFVRNLPGVNRALLFSGIALIGWGLLATAGPPVATSVASGVGEAVRPYTAEGKQETCLSNMRAVGLALALYRQDNDDTFPPVDYVVQKAGQGATTGKDRDPGGAGRTTWVSLLASRTSSGNFLCPLKSVSDPQVESSYGFNAALAAGAWGSVRTGELADPDKTLVLADRADRHDVALLPPFTAWQKAGGAPSKDSPGNAELSNIDFRHANSAIFLYADGHAASESNNDRLQESLLWGGSPMLRQARARLRTQHPVLSQVQAALLNEQERAALRLMKVHKNKVREGLKEVLALWKQNGNTDVTGVDVKGMDKETDKWGWRLAGLWEQSGEREMLQELNREQSRRSGAEWGKVQKGTWQKHESDLGFAIEVPASWTVSTEPNGRYTNTFFRSGSPYISVLVEKGTRSTPGDEAGVDWGGMERDYRKSYGSRYKRIRRETAMLAGEEANLWEFEIERKGEPRLRKLYLGRSHIWDSYVLVWTVPAADHLGGELVCNKILSTLGYR